MQLIDVYETPEAVDVLYALMQERPTESWISHQGLPSIEEHRAFVASKPFRYWFLIQTMHKLRPTYIGAIECSNLNEVGISLFSEYHGRGYGMQALRLFLETHYPLSPIKAIRNGNWLANIAVGNEHSIRFFAQAGFQPLQITMVLPQ